MKIEEVENMENIINELKKWVKENYVQYATGWTYKRSEGNFYDCLMMDMNAVIQWLHMTLVVS